MTIELPPLPNKAKLYTAMPDDYRYGHVYGYTADQMREYARAVEQAAYEAAIKACESLENRVISTHPARIEFDPNSLMARKCADVIRSLMTQEQPK